MPAKATGSISSVRVESPKMELVQGVGLMLWCLQNAQLSAAFTYDSPGKSPCQLQHSTARKTICCDLASVCLAVRRHTVREGQPWPPWHPSAAGDGLPSPISPSSEKAKQENWPSHEQIDISEDKQQSHCKLLGTLRPYPLSRS